MSKKLQNLIAQFQQFIKEETGGQVQAIHLSPKAYDAVFRSIGPIEVTGTASPKSELIIFLTINGHTIQVHKRGKD